MSAWHAGPLKYWLSLNDSGVWGDDPTDSGDTPVVRSTDINLDGSWDLSDVAYRHLEPDERASKTLVEGDLVVVKSSGSPQHLGKTALVDTEVASLKPCFANFVQRLRPNAQTDPRYVWYLLNSHRAAAEMEIMGNTTTGLRNLNSHVIGSVTFPGPRLDVQRRITDYLDAETARIDALIEKKQLMAGLIDEHWKSVLDEAFDSGNKLCLKRLVTASLAYGVLVPDHDPDGVPMLRIMDLKTSGVDLDSVARIPSSLSAQYRRTVLQSGDLVVSVVGTLGRCIEVDASLAGCNINRPLARVQLRSDVPRSLIRYWFESSHFRRMAQMATSSDSAQPTLGMEDLGNMALGLPWEPSEWSSLSRRLEEEEEQVMGALQRLQRQIALLQERRQALITAAVTGQIDIPGLAA